MIYGFGARRWYETFGCALSREGGGVGGARTEHKKAGRRKRDLGAGIKGMLWSCGVLMNWFVGL